jgi:transposase-like protein
MTKPIARDPIYRRRVFDAEIIQLSVRWYITYRLSYRDLVELMAERGVQVAHSTILWRVNEACIAIRGKWHYLYRAVDKHGKTVDFLLRREHLCWRNVTVRTNKYLNNLIEQDHRAIKRRCASMAGFKSFAGAAITLAGIELAHRVRKRQFSFGRGWQRRSMSLKRLWELALA